MVYEVPREKTKTSEPTHTFTQLWETAYVGSYATFYRFFCYPHLFAVFTKILTPVFTLLKKSANYLKLNINLNIWPEHAQF